MLLGSKKVRMCRYVKWKKRVCIPRVLSHLAQWYLVPTQVTVTVSCFMVCKQRKIGQSQGVKHKTVWTIWNRWGRWVNESVEELSDWARKGKGRMSNIWHRERHTRLIQTQQIHVIVFVSCWTSTFNINQTNCASSPQPPCTSHRISFCEADVIPHTYTWGGLVSHVSDELLLTLKISYAYSST